MHLTDEEKRMLAGDEGEAVQMAMQILTRLGDVYGAERMVDIRSAHTFMGYMNLKSSVDLVEKFANYDGMNEVYRDYFETDYPARACIKCELFRKELLVEVEAVAVLA